MSLAQALRAADEALFDAAKAASKAHSPMADRLKAMMNEIGAMFDAADAPQPAMQEAAE